MSTSPVRILCRRLGSNSGQFSFSTQHFWLTHGPPRVRPIPLISSKAKRSSPKTTQIDHARIGAITVNVFERLTPNFVAVRPRLVSQSGWIAVAAGASEGVRLATVSLLLAHGMEGQRDEGVVQPSAQRT